MINWQRLLQRKRRAMGIMAFGTLHDKHNPKNECVKTTVIPPSAPTSPQHQV